MSATRKLQIQFIYFLLFPIFKISERVFRLDNFQSNTDIKFVKEFCEILDLGLKFVPSLFKNLTSFFTYFLLELNKSFTKLNNFIFFEKNKKDQIKAKKDSTFVETILQSLKSTRIKSNNRKLDNIPLQHETIEIRNSLFSKFTDKNKFKLSSNLTLSQISCIKKFLKEKPFILCNSDKNVGWVLLDKPLYIKLANDHLTNNTNTYNLLEKDPLEETISKINDSLTKLNNNSHISLVIQASFTEK